MSSVKPLAFCHSLAVHKGEDEYESYGVAAILPPSALTTLLTKSHLSLLTITPWLVTPL